MRASSIRTVGRYLANIKLLSLVTDMTHLVGRSDVVRIVPLREIGTRRNNRPSPRPHPAAPKISMRTLHMATYVLSPASLGRLNEGRFRPDAVKPLLERLARRKYKWTHC